MVGSVRCHDRLSRVHSECQPTLRRSAVAWCPVVPPISANVQGPPNRPNHFVSRPCFLRSATARPRLHLYSAGWVGGRRRRPKPEALLLAEVGAHYSRPPAAVRITRPRPNLQPPARLTPRVLNSRWTSTRSAESRTWPSGTATRGDANRYSESGGGRSPSCASPERLSQVTQSSAIWPASIRNIPPIWDSIRLSVGGKGPIGPS